MRTPPASVAFTVAVLLVALVVAGAVWVVRDLRRTARLDREWSKLSLPDIPHDPP